ncbi:E3 ubiquitin-protein ligase SINAT5-like [Folsomia candida]|uniref:E3 ubiquitin-protein ligase SINAT5-like n=1 Tax=Folsomia candida TaxID=158441 RepID=UPI0016050E75|nr:E3 ubiquitin-protein ligase SINAT5-like [Folsomia candida]
MAGYRPTAPPPNLEDALECTICLDTPVSPIHQCDNGHIVCGTCAGRMTACGLCKTKLQISILAERLSRQLDLKPSCPYSIAGCVTKISRAEMVSHQAKCYYRDVICEDPKWPPCDRVPIPFGDFFNHLHTNHQIDLDEINLGQFCDRTGIVLPVFGGDQFRDLEREQIVKLVKKNGQAFLLHCHIDTDLATFWMTVLGDEAEANKHWFQIKLGNENKTEAKKQNVAKCETTSTKVHPIVYAKPVRTNGAAGYSSILVEDCIWFRPMGSKDYQYTAQLTIKNESTSGEMFIVWIETSAPKRYRASHRIFLLSTHETVCVTIVIP